MSPPLDGGRTSGPEARPVVRSYRDAERAEWDDFVRCHPEAGYGHLSANFALAARDPRLENCSLVVREGSGRILAVLPLFERRSTELRIVPTCTLLSGAYFPAGPLLATHASGGSRDRLVAALLEAVDGLARKRAIDRIVIAYVNVVEGRPGSERLPYLPLRAHGYRETNVLGMLLDLEQPEPALVAAFRERARRALRKAHGAGLACEALADRAAWLACEPLARACLGREAWTPAQMEAIWDAFVAPGHASIFACRAGADPVSVVVAVHWNRCAYYWIGLNRHPAVPGANHLALREAILARRRAGDRTFELGSKDFGAGKQADISNFKESFGPRVAYGMGGVREMRPARRALLDIGHAVVGRLRGRVP